MSLLDRDQWTHCLAVVVAETTTTEFDLTRRRHWTGNDETSGTKSGPSKDDTLYAMSDPLRAEWRNEKFSIVTRTFPEQRHQRNALSWTCIFRSTIWSTPLLLHYQPLRLIILHSLPLSCSKQSTILPPPCRTVLLLVIPVPLSGMWLIQGGVSLWIRQSIYRHINWPTMDVHPSGWWCGLFYIKSWIKNGSLSVEGVIE